MEQIKGCKLTDLHDQTYNKCQWGKNIEHVTDGEWELCTGSWIHFYKNPLLAVLLNHIHGSYYLKTAHFWECSIAGKVRGDNGLKWGATKVRTIKRISLPKITTEQRIKFGILCALEICKDGSFTEWAKNWLSGKDRGRRLASTCIIYNTACATDAARSAVRAAYGADNAVIDANATRHAANAAYYAARHGIYHGTESINLNVIAKKAMGGDDHETKERK